MKYFYFFLLSSVFFSCAKEQDTKVTVFVNELEASNSQMTFSITAQFEEGDVSSAGILYRFAPNIDLKADYGFDPADEFNSSFNFNFSQFIYHNARVVSVKGNEKTLTVTLNNSSYIPGANYSCIAFTVVNGKLHFSDEFSFKSPELENVKMGPAGGYIIYEDGNGGGIEVTPFILSVKNSQDNQTPFNEFFTWGCEGSFIYGTQDGVGTGQQNTDTIMAQCSVPSNPAKICKELSYGGYSDWYLPSKDEILLASPILENIYALKYTYNYVWVSSYTGEYINFNNELFFLDSGGRSIAVIAARTF